MRGSWLQLLTITFVLAVSSSLLALPLAPDDLRVADSATGWGQKCGMGEGAGVSTHPWFSVVHNATAPGRSAVNVRVQVALDQEFLALIWDSGFAAINPTGPNFRTPNVAYAGPALLPGMNYFLRVGTRDDQGNASPFSGVLKDGSTPSFSVTAPLGACDLRVQSSAANAQQGNPVTLPSFQVSFSAEFVGAVADGRMAQVQVSASFEFEVIEWDSGWQEIPDVNPGQRCAAVLSTGIFDPGRGYFWRIRFMDSNEETSNWSSASASFLIDPPDPTQPAPAGFGNQKRDLGLFGALSGDVVVADINNDGVPDAVVVSETAGDSHAIHLSFGATNPGATLCFGSASGGSTRVACLDLDLDNDLDLAIACGGTVTIYMNEGLTFAPVGTIDIPGTGELQDLFAADFGWSGWPGLVANFTNSVHWLPNNGGVFGTSVLVTESGAPILDVAVEDLIDEGQPEISVLAGGLLTAFTVQGDLVFPVATWEFPEANQIVIAKGELDYARDILCTNGWQVELRRLDERGEWSRLKQSTIERGGRCHELLLGNINGDGFPDLALLLDTGSLFCRQTDTGFAEHEYAGYGQEGTHTRGAFCDANLDGRLDLLLLRPGASSQLHFNQARRTVEIHDAGAVQPSYGEGYIEFEVVLDAPSCSLVEVDCSTDEEEGEGEGDGVGNLGSMAQGQAAPLPYVPTTTRLYFVPGQTRACFRVMLTKAMLPSVTTKQVYITDALGAVVMAPIATGSVYAPGASSSGPAATTGMLRDWTLRGQINAVAQHASGNTYFGGEFDGVEWQVEGVAALDSLGVRQRALRGISGTIKAVAMDTDGSAYVGGHFEVYHQGQWFKNIVKLRYDGSIDPAFRPNPDNGTGEGVVNAIVLKAGSVYFGGRFSSIVNCSFPLKNIAQVSSSGAYPPRPDRFRVYRPSGYGEPAQQPAEVLSMLISDSGVGVNEFLIVGGRNFYRAENSSGSYQPVLNFALFGLGGSIVPNMPRVDGQVRALAVSDEMFSNWGGGGLSRTILFGGNFEWVHFPKMGAGAYETRMNLNSTNFSGELKYSKHASALSLTPVNALLVESGNRLWVGRARQHMGVTLDPLAIYTVYQGNFTCSTTFASGLNLSVNALALGDSEVLVTGDFSQRTTATGTVPVGRSLLFSTQTLGDVSTAFRSSFDQPILCAASGRDAQNRLRGFVIGGLFTKLIAQRGNLAAMNAAGELLPWGPSVDGPVHALTTDGTDVFFGGNFTTATGTQVLSRRSLASAPANDTAIDANNWIADLSGSAMEARSLALDGSSLVVGGDFTAINGTLREDAAAVSKTAGGPPWLAGVTPWDAALAHDAASNVFALTLSSGLIYIGGSFSGTTSVPRPGLLVVTAPSAGPTVLLDWDAAIASPCAVRAVGVSNNDVFFAGQFSSVGSISRLNIAAVPKWAGVPGAFPPTSFAPAISGNLYALAVLPSGLVYVAGESLSVSVGGTPVLRRGVAAFDAVGTLLSWEGPVLSAATGEAVRTLLLDDSQAVARLWVGGNFTGTAHPGQNDLTWFTRAWNITTPNLPNANEDAAYGPVQITLSESATCTWSIYAPNAPWLQIDANTGEISGFCPLGAPALITVQVTATQSPTAAASKWFLLAVTPKPPPTTISVFGPGLVTESNSPFIEPAPVVAFMLNQLFSADVVIEVQYIDGSAFNGRDYAGRVVLAVIPAGLWGVNIPLCIFGDNIIGNPQRTFTVKAVVHTPNVNVSATAGQCIVTILEDDPPQPRHAIAGELRLWESSAVPADLAHVVANQPVFKWSFRSDFVGDAQTGWQVQVFTSADFSGSPVWDSGAQSGTDEEVQLGAVGGAASLADGQNYYARVRLWSSPTDFSEWLPLALRTNTPPPAAVLLTPLGTVPMSRPTLTWEVHSDADGDALNFKVTLNGASTIVLDSATQPWIFERYETSSGRWVAFGQAGAGAGTSKVRVTIPLGSALSAGLWDWTVEANDGFETTPVAFGGFLTMDVQPAYAISGKVLNGQILDANRTVSVYRLPGNTLLGSNFTNSNGEFIIPIGGSLVVGDVLAVLIDNPAIPPAGYTPAYAASFLRFAGNDLVEVSGPNSGVELKHGRVEVDPRGQDALTLGSLVDSTSCDPDWPFTVSVNQLVLRPEMTGLDLNGSLAVLGTGAAAAEPTVLSLPGLLFVQEVRVNVGGALLVQEAARVETQALANEGCVSLESGSALKLSAASSTSGQFVAQSGGLLELNLAQLTVNAGYPQFHSASIQGISGNETVLVQGGALSASGTGFHSVTLEVGILGDVTDLDGAVFDGATPDHRIGWERQRAISATLRGIRFEPGATNNVVAAAGADTLTLIGCGGDLAGEAFDVDPGEATAQDIVNWTLSTIGECRAIAGNTRVLLVWAAGAQSGAGFTYNIHASVAPGGPFTLVAATPDSFFVESNLPNGAARYYFVELAAWGTHSTWSELLEATPQPPTLESAFPIGLRETGTAAGMAQGGETHFKASTVITSPQSGVSVPVASVDVISETLILFDVETNAAALGMVDIEIATPDVWVERSAPGYAETVSFQAEVKPPATPNYPRVVFVQTGGAVGPDTLTDGAFSVAVEFDASGGAEIDPQSFECVVDRNIMVGGQIVAAGTNLASAALGLWGTPTTTGATWQVDQIQVTTDPQEEFISRGELIISVRVANEFGFKTSWNPMRIHVQGSDPYYAKMDVVIKQGVPNQVVYIHAAALINVNYDVEFPQGAGITVNSVSTQAYGSGYELRVVLSASDDAPEGAGEFICHQRAPLLLEPYGTYRVEHEYPSLFSLSGPGHGPRAEVGAVNVYLQTGEFFWKTTDLVTKARKLQIAWERTYRGWAHDAQLTPLGRGWFNAYFQFVELNSSMDKIRWLTPGGDLVEFASRAQKPDERRGCAVYEWQAPPGYNVIVKTWPLDSQRWCSIQTAEGMTYTYSRTITNTLTESSRLNLREVQDSYLNSIRLEYDNTVDRRLLKICGDSGNKHGAENPEQWSENLILDYASSRLEGVKRVLSRPTAPQTVELNNIGYSYINGQLSQHRIINGHRFGAHAEHLYHTYNYVNARLTQIIPPSQSATSPSIPALTIHYDPSGRVDKQTLGPVNVSDKREYQIQYQTNPDQWIVTPPSGASGALTYELNNAGQATKIVKAIEGGVATTTFTFDSATQNLIDVTHPGGARTKYTYHQRFEPRPSEHNYTSMAPGANGTTIVSSPDDLENFSDRLVRLTATFGQQPSQHKVTQYFVADRDSDPKKIIIEEDLIALGWPQMGTFVLALGGTNSLSCSIVLQERRCAGAVPRSSDLITTYIYEDTSFYGDYYCELQRVIDPLGNEIESSNYLPKGYSSTRSNIYMVRKTTLRKAEDATNDEDAVGVQISETELDKFGRVISESTPSAYHLTTTYSYSETTSGAFGSGEYLFQLKCVTSKGNHESASATTSYSYNSRGDIEQITLPGDVADFAAVDFKQQVWSNEAGQIYHTKGPVTGTPTAKMTPESWMYYDRDGRLEYVMEKFVPQGGAEATTSGATGTELNAEVDPISSNSKFPTPAYDENRSPGPRWTSGWICTRYTYNAWGELQREARIIDKIEGAATTWAETNFSYDLDGRLAWTADPCGYVTKSTYNSRGQVTSVKRGSRLQVDEVVDTGATSTESVKYNERGQLIEEVDSLGARTKYQYDGYGRPKRVSHRNRYGFKLHELFEHPRAGSPFYTHYTATGPEGALDAQLVKVRGMSVQHDELGRAYRFRTLSRDADNLHLEGSSGGWSVSASALSTLGQPLQSWMRTFDNPSAQSEKTEYDDHARPLAAYGARSSVSDVHDYYVYDAAGNVSESGTPVIDHNKNVVYSSLETKFDPNNRPWRAATHWNGGGTAISATEYRRNNLGWPEVVIDGAGRKTQMEYTLAGLVRRIAVLDGTQETSITVREYYVNGSMRKETALRADNPQGLTSASPQDTFYYYDTKNRLTDVYRAGVGSWNYTYDERDLVLTERRPDGTLITNIYGKGGELTLRVISSVSDDRTTAPPGTPPPPTIILGSEEYTTDDLGQVTEAFTKDGYGKVTTKLEMTYNSLGLVESQILTVYDAQGNAIAPTYFPHLKTESLLGFKSLYETAIGPFNSWEVSVKYDCWGRERQLKYWDKRTVASDYQALRAKGLRDTGSNGAMPDITQDLPLTEYFYKEEILNQRDFFGKHGDVRHVKSMRPSEPGTVAMSGSGRARSWSFFGSDPHGGLATVSHTHRSMDAAYATYDFGKVETRYDKSGNPVLERALHRGGLSRVMAYDHSSRLTTSWYGHLIKVSDPSPGLTADVPAPPSPQWTRGYTQDTLDNITKVDDLIATKSSSVDMPVVSGTENLIQSIGGNNFTYDDCKSIETDPTTGLTYKYNYRGQLESVTRGSDAVRNLVYDCFGRMVHLVEAPGTTVKRGTIFIPNVGFGGGGDGADYAGEVTYTDNGSGPVASEVLQYSYGIGAIGGGLGRKRLVELVAFCGEFAPYFRFLNENTQGDTIATTSLWGDRLDEYDYTDYGVPLHAPVALDGRWIVNVTAGSGDFIHTTTIELASTTLLQPNELLGCEFRFALKDAANAESVFLAGAVISQVGKYVKIHDQGGAIATAWASHAHKPSACFYDLREGYYKGVQTGAVSYGTETWGSSVSVTYLTVDSGPFTEAMYSDPPTVLGGKTVTVAFGSYDGSSVETATVIKADTPVSGAGNSRLILYGTFGAANIGPGKWYRIIGACGAGEVARCGRWAVDAGHSGPPNGGLTTFVCESYAELGEFQQGWWLQPDINCQAWFPIVSVNAANHTLTVEGDHKSLGVTGKQFRIHAPPGVKTRVPFAGTLPKFAEASSSRCLYKGYRYENPAAGLWDDVAQGVAARQGGKNFTGQHYTLFRHFDPSLMRFTSLDPLASSSNLFAYCENNPHGSYDPDGLESLNVAEYGRRVQDRTGPLGGSMKGMEWSQAYSGGGGIAGALDSLSSAPAGALYGAANTLTFGYYGENISREQFAGFWGVNANSVGFAAGEATGTGVAAAVIAMATAGGVSSALGAAMGCGYTGLAAVIGEGVAWGLGNVAAGNAVTRSTEGRWMSASENLLAFDLGMIGGMTGRVWGGAAMEARNLFGAPGKSVCFVAGTQVAVAGDSGTITGKAIEDIELGDWVWSRNDETGEEGYKPVVHLFRNTTEELAHLTYTSGTGLPTREGTLTGTPGHKFWSETRQAWTPMGKLQPGEKLKLADDSTATVSACTVEHLTQPVAIYNFEVADWHTYHVGSASSGWVWVHNRNCSYDSTAKRWRDLETGQFVKAPPHNKVLRPDAQATLYQKVGAKGEHRKWGMTFHKDPRLRYTAAEIGKGGDVLPVRRSQRRSIAAQERRLVETDPGPENHEPWAGWRKPGHPNYRGK